MCFDRTKMPRQGLLESGQRPATWSRRGQRLAMGRRFRKKVEKEKKGKRAGRGWVVHPRLPRHAIFLGVTALAVTMADAHGGRSLAQGKLDARYTVTLSGLPIGQGAWIIDIGDDYFTASASGATAGLLRVFASGQGQSAARGSISSGQLVPSTYASRIITDDKSDEVRMVISARSVKEFAANPPTVASPDRVPVTDAHRRGVSDPMTASLIRVPGSGDTLVPQACQRTLSIFDGRMRYDLQLAFKRLERVRADRGYQGAAGGWAWRLLSNRRELCES